MPIPIPQGDAGALANKLLNALKHAHAMCTQSQTDNAANVYNNIVNIPEANKYLQDAISSVTSSGNISRVVSQLNELLPSDVTITDVQNFATALNSFAADVEANINLFLLTINATTKRPEFVTPVAQGVKDTIDSRITAVLAEVS